MTLKYCDIQMNEFIILSICPYKLVLTLGKGLFPKLQLKASFKQSVKLNQGSN